MSQNQQPFNTMEKEKIFWIGGQYTVYNNRQVSTVYVKLLIVPSPVSYAWT